MLYFGKKKRFVSRSTNNKYKEKDSHKCMFIRKIKRVVLGVPDGKSFVILCNYTAITNLNEEFMSRG